MVKILIFWWFFGIQGVFFRIHSDNFWGADVGRKDSAQTQSPINCARSTLGRFSPLCCWIFGYFWGFGGRGAIFLGFQKMIIFWGCCCRAQRPRTHGITYKLCALDPRPRNTTMLVKFWVFLRIWGVAEHPKNVDFFAKFAQKCAHRQLPGRKDLACTLARFGAVKFCHGFPRQSQISTTECSKCCHRF